MKSANLKKRIQSLEDKIQVYAEKCKNVFTGVWLHSRAKMWPVANPAFQHDLDCDVDADCVSGGILLVPEPVEPDVWESSAIDFHNKKQVLIERKRRAEFGLLTKRR